MKNLLTKLLLIPALAFSLNSGIKAQDENKERAKFNLSFTFGFELGGSYSNQKLLSDPIFYLEEDIKKKYVLPQGDLFWVLEP